MAFSLYTSMTFLLQFLLLILTGYLFARTSGAGLQDVCPRTQDPAFCLNDFGSNPSIQAADLPTLAKTAIQKAIDDGTCTSSKIMSLFQSTTDPRTKDLLFQCKIAYDGALTVLKEAPGDLDRCLLRDLRLHSGQASDAAERCETSFTGPCASPLTRENKEMKALCSIIGVIADVLNSGKQRS